MKKSKSPIQNMVQIGASILICVLFSAAGGLLGAYLGGNLVVDLSLFGVRGYEAAGLLGFILGLLGGILLIRRIWK